ncbi:MAG: acyltransferase family protein [Pseudomonadota bacterium]
MTAIAYRPEIDGLRSFAILPVMFFHAGLPLFSGGYLGVDVFFVISGYLITAIIIKDLDQGRFSILKFYERRARRILPALFTVLLFTTVVAWLWMTLPQWDDYAESLVAVSLFASNILFWRQTGYFDQSAELKPLLHTWTLSVEEQFYIIFPVLLILIWRYRANAALWFLLAIGLTSLAFSEYASRALPMTNFYLLPSRAWELMAGSLCAVFMKSSANRLEAIGPRLGGMLGLVGLALVVASNLVFTPETRSPALITLFPIGGTALIILFARGETFAARLLSWKPFVAIGLISYSAYLWHQPLLAFYRIKYFHHDPLVIAALMVLALLLAWLTYVVIEKPARFTLLKNRSNKLILFIAAAALAATAGVGLAGRFTSWPALPTVAGLSDRGDPEDTFGWYFRNDKADQDGGLLLYGDSHARHYVGALDGYAKDQDVPFEYIGEYACMALPGVTSLFQGRVRPDCTKQLNRLRTNLAEKSSVLVIAQFWDIYVADDQGQQIGTDGSANDPKAASAILTGLDSLFEILPDNQPVVLIGSAAGTLDASEQMKEGYFRCLQYIDGDCPSAYPARQSRYRAFNARLAQLADKYDNVRFVDPFAALCDAQQCRIVENGKIIYVDEGHLTRDGSEKVIRAFAPTFAEAIAELP